MQYAFIYHVAREQRDEVQLLLDSYVTKEAIEYYDAFKQGKPYIQVIQAEPYMPFGKATHLRLILFRIMPTEAVEHLLRRQRLTE